MPHEHAFGFPRPENSNTLSNLTTHLDGREQYHVVLGPDGILKRPLGSVDGRGGLVHADQDLPRHVALAAMPALERPLGSLTR